MEFHSNPVIFGALQRPSFALRALWLNPTSLIPDFEDILSLGNINVMLGATNDEINHVTVKAKEIAHATSLVAVVSQHSKIGPQKNYPFLHLLTSLNKYTREIRPK
ncbi:hypothetical protein ACJX0J_023419, partial [Zea mays]